MIERDYLMRLMSQFLNALRELFLNTRGRDSERLNQQLNELCELYLGNNQNYFVETSAAEIIDALETKGTHEALIRAEMIAEMLYQSANNTSNPTRRNSLLQKVLDLLNYIESNSKTFCYDRQIRIKDIEATLKQQ